MPPLDADDLLHRRRHGRFKRLASSPLCVGRVARATLAWRRRLEDRDQLIASNISNMLKKVSSSCVSDTESNISGDTKK